MNVLDPLSVATGAAWFAWQPMTPAECMTLTLGAVALTLAARGLRQMRVASAARDRQLDAQTEMLATQTESLAALTRMVDERTMAQTDSLAVLTRMVDERTMAQTESLAALARMLDERTAALMRSLETVIERTKGD